MSRELTNLRRPERIKHYDSLIKSEIVQIKNQENLLNESQALGYWFASNFLDLDKTRILNHVLIDNPDDHKLDLGYIDYTEKIVYIIQVKYKRTLNLKRPFRSLDKLDDIRLALSRLDTSASIPASLRSNTKWVNFADEYRKIKDNKNYTKRLIFVVNGYVDQKYIEYFEGIEIEIFDINKLVNIYTLKTNPFEIDSPNKLKFDIINQMVEKEQDRVKSATCIIPLIFPYIWVRNFGNGVFQKNIRFRLTKKRNLQIAGMIMRTVEDNPEMMIELNNGLTIASFMITPIKKKIELVKPFIVNGCQTSYAIYEKIDEFMSKVLKDLPNSEKDILISFLDNPHNEWDFSILKLTNLLKKTSIFSNNSVKKLLEMCNHGIIAKVIQVASEESLTDIVLAANRQNPINERDLLTLDALQKDIQTKLAESGIYYFVRPGEIKGLSDNDRSTFLTSNNRERTIEWREAGQIYLAQLGYPSYAQDKKNKLTDDKDYYNGIYNYLDEDSLDIIKTNSGLDLLLDKGLENLAFDLKFGNFVYCLSKGLDNLYLQKKRRIQNLPVDQRDSLSLDLLEDIMNFYSYWSLWLVRLIRYIFEHHISQGSITKEGLFEVLFGNDIDIFFQTPNTIKESFISDLDLKSYTILAPTGHLEQECRFPVLQMWITKLDSIIFNYLTGIKETEGSIDFRGIFYRDYNSDHIKNIENVIAKELRGPERAKLDYNIT